MSMDVSQRSTDTGQDISPIIRDAAESDLPAIADIINHYRQHTSHIWDRTVLSPEDMESWLAAHRSSPYTAIVAELTGQVVGYASLSQFRPYRGYDVTAENSIYLAPGQEGRGIGAALMTQLLQRAWQNGFKAITAWIDSNNSPSVRFHEKFGFRHAGTMERVGMLDGRLTSVIIMVLNFTNAEEQ